MIDRSGHESIFEFCVFLEYQVFGHVWKTEKKKKSHGQPVHFLIRSLLRSRCCEAMISRARVRGKNPSALGSRELHVIGLSLTLFSTRC